MSAISSIGKDRSEKVPGVASLLFPYTSSGNDSLHPRTAFFEVASLRRLELPEMVPSERRDFHVLISPTEGIFGSLYPIT
jgi:hypothetical protein